MNNTSKTFDELIDLAVVSADEPQDDKIPWAKRDQMPTETFLNNQQRLKELSLRHDDAWKIASNDGDFVILAHIYRANPAFKQVDEMRIRRSVEDRTQWFTLLPVGTIGSLFQFWKVGRVLRGMPFAGSVVVFDANTPRLDEPTEHPTQAAHIVPSLHITSPILHHADFSRPFEISGFFERDIHGDVEHFVGQMRWDVNGRVVDAKFKNPAMQAEAEQWRLEDRPKIVYWHSNDPDGGLQLKAMSAAAGG